MRRTELTGIGRLRQGFRGRLIAQVEERVTSIRDGVPDRLRWRDATVEDYRSFGWRFLRGNIYEIDKR